MNKGLPLHGRLLAGLLLNLLVACLAMLLLFPQRLGLGGDVLLTAAVRERLQSIAESVIEEIGPALQATHPAELQRFDQLYGVQFAIYNGGGKLLAGEDLPLSHEIRNEFGLTHALVAALTAQAASPGAGPSRPESAPLELPAWPKPSRDLLKRWAFSLRDADSGLYCIGVRITVPAEDGGLLPVTVLAATPSRWRAVYFLSFSGWLLSIGALIVLSLLCWAPLLWALAGSLGKIASATERIGEEQFDVRLQLRRGDELGRLAEGINTVAGRLENFVRNQRQFLSAIAHEVSTPLARLRVGLENLQPQLPREAERDFQDVHEEAELLSDLIGELLAFTRAGIKPPQSKLTSVALRSLLISVLERENIRIGVTIDAASDLKVRANPHSLSRALGNLLRNAVRYAGTASGPIEVTAEALENSVLLRVRDRGPGVPEMALLRLGDPFYRPEASRKRTAGGIGLGLATVKNCVAACGGSITFRNRSGGGFEAEIKLSRAGMASGRYPAA